MTFTMQQELSARFSKGDVCEPRFAKPLGNDDKCEVLNFLAARPIHTVVMSSLIRDNGLNSKLNRGSFFGCRTLVGALDGVAMIGHATLIETENSQCLKAFAEVAQTYPPAHVIRGEQHKIESFWQYYSGGVRRPRVLCGEQLLQLKSIPAGVTAVSGLRRATIADLEPIVQVNAMMVCDESGINPLDRDPNGFRTRAARRIGKGRVWVWMQGERLIYKTDIVAETPQAIYLEGVYVDPDHRNQRYGLRCISQLATSLLSQTESICLTVNERATASQRFYKRAGYEVVCRYDSIYPDQSN